MKILCLSASYKPLLHIYDLAKHVGGPLHICQGLCNHLMEELFKLLNSCTEGDGGMIKEERYDFIENLKSECLEHIKKVLKLEDKEEYKTAENIHLIAQSRVKDALVGLMKAEVDRSDLIPLIESELELAKGMRDEANLASKYTFLVRRLKGAKELKKAIEESN